MKTLIAAGLDTLSADADIGAEWTEAARSIRCSTVPTRDRRPPEGIRARRARQRAAAGIFGQPAAGDRRGGANRGRHDRTHGARSSAASISGSLNTPARRTSIARTRKAIIVESIRDYQHATAPAIGAAIRGALVGFVETPGQTLIIKLTPRGKVPAMQLIQLLKTDPLIALAQFRIEASTGL